MIIGKTEDLQVSFACVLVGAVSPIVLPVKLLFPPIVAIALGGLGYIIGILSLSSIPFLSIGLGVYIYTKWNIIVIIILILVLMILFIRFTAKFLMAYVLCAAVGFIVLSYTQEVFFYGKLLIQSASLIQQIITNLESLSHLFSVLLKIVNDSSILTLDRYDLFNLFIKPFADKFIILLSSLFLSIALSLGRFRFFRLNEKG